jgi:hypothetical protein
MQRTPGFLPVSIQGYARGVVARLGCSEMNAANVNVCRHCNKEITQINGRMWCGGSKMFSQYCWVDPVEGSQLHEPLYKEQAK